VRWPRPLLIRPWPWNYWWQAHLLDCLVDAHRRAPEPLRAVEIAALARTVRLRNLGSWTNDYYDDIAWFGLAVQRAGPLARRSAPSALAAITARLHAGWTPAGGGIWWRGGDDFKNAPANGPAAMLAARTGDLDFATKITDWIAATLVDPQTGLVRDGVRLNPDGTIHTVEATTYTYCQGVYLGACVELAERDGHPRWAESAATVLNAVITMAGPDGVIPGFDDGGDGGLCPNSWECCGDPRLRDVRRPSRGDSARGARSAWPPTWQPLGCCGSCPVLPHHRDHPVGCSCRQRRSCGSSRQGGRSWRRQSRR
jgi:predicted alpha-1,6-mannanase (GH76 family)